ncbi:MAG: YitT family protein [Dialister sp.]|nr:YitT family protein [Dialister sp.]
METKQKTKKLTLEQLLFLLAVTVAGTFIYSAAVNLFFVPHHFLAGGMTGVAMIVYYLTDIPIGWSNLALNVPILMMSLKWMGTLYTGITIIGTVLISVFVDVTAPLATMNVVKNPLVSAIAGGVMLGISMGILYRYNSNSGGLDVIGAIIKKYYNLEIGYVVFALNFIIVLAGAWFFALEPAICTLIGMYICANLSARLVLGFAQRKAAFIVSDHPLELSDAILRHIHHGATLLYGQGAFSGTDKRIIFAIVDLTQVTRLRHLIESIDPKAFIFIMNTTDVVGRGFTSPLSTPLTMPSSLRYTVDGDGKLAPTRMWEYEMNLEREPEDDTQPLPKIDDK